MIILGIETSCDETAISLIDANTETQIDADGTLMNADKETSITVLADKTLSQIALHQKYGGVFPSIAKREHAKNLIPLLKQMLMESDFLKLKVKSEKLKVGGNLPTYPPDFAWTKSWQADNLQLATILEREPELLEQFLKFIPIIQKPPIDVIAVTEGPGLEPCLWTGLNFARALSLVWNIPVVPVNHMEGHIVSALLKSAETAEKRGLNAEGRGNKNLSTYKLINLQLPSLALLISGGHTELVLIRDYFKYEIVGATRDDAVGEAFDKVARLLGLPYPGGPQISALAEIARTNAPACRKGRDLTPTNAEKIKLPRPMIKSEDLNFSFAGLKTAVLYLVKKLPKPLDDKTKAAIAREFEDAVTDVLIAKTKRAIGKYNCKTLLIGGGVIANTHIRRAFENMAFAYGRKQMPRKEFLHIPEAHLTTDNALMIAVAGYLRYSLKNGLTKAQEKRITAKGNLRLDEK